MKEEATNGNCPIRHLAIIMDGNGRWAKKRFLPRIEGHRRGAATVEEIMTASFNLGVEYLTLYTFSIENWNRPQNEIEGLMNLLVSNLKKHRKAFLKNQIRFLTIGRLKELPQEVIEAVEELKEVTKHFSSKNLVLALNYGSRTEVLDAVKSCIAEGKSSTELTWDDLSKYLYTSNIPDPDLIIRTSGEKRLSNFLLLQAAYSEIYYTDLHWPEFKKEHLLEAFEDFKKRRRRFGKTDEQIETIETS